MQHSFKYKVTFTSDPVPCGAARAAYYAVFAAMCRNMLPDRESVGHRHHAMP